MEDTPFCLNSNFVIKVIYNELKEDLNNYGYTLVLWDDSLYNVIY